MQANVETISGQPFLSTIAELCHSNLPPNSKPAQQSSLFEDAILVMKNKVEIPDVVPEMYRDIWLSLADDTKRFAISSYDDDPKQMEEFLALQVPARCLLTPSQKIRKHWQKRRNNSNCLAPSLLT